MSFSLSQRKINIILIVVIFCITSCGSNRDLVYFSDLPQTGNTIAAKDLPVAITNNEAKIAPNDILAITVTSLSPESNNLFNNYNPNAPNYNNNPTKDGYQVDKNGFISFPVLRDVKLAGLTLYEAKQKLLTGLKAYIKEPSVSISFVNFKVTVIGEVNHPGTFTVDNDDVNLLEALGLAGDMTAYGKRENVLVIRQIEGKRNIVRLNMNNSDILNSPYYYLKQNDIVYVEPDKSKRQEIDQSNRFIPIIAASFSVVAVLVSVLIKR